MTPWLSPEVGDWLARALLVAICLAAFGWPIFHINQLDKKGKVR